jgi:hypothetical protein
VSQRPEPSAPTAQVRRLALAPSPPRHAHSPDLQPFWTADHSVGRDFWPQLALVLSYAVSASPVPPSPGRALSRGFWYSEEQEKHVAKSNRQKPRRGWTGPEMWGVGLTAGSLLVAIIALVVQSASH